MIITREKIYGLYGLIGLAAKYSSNTLKAHSQPIILHINLSAIVFELIRCRIAHINRPQAYSLK